LREQSAVQAVVVLRRPQANTANLRLAGVGCSAASNPFRGERRGHARVQSPPISQTFLLQKQEGWRLQQLAHRPHVFGGHRPIHHAVIAAEGNAHPVTDLDLVALIHHGLLDDGTDGENHTADSG